MAGLPWFRMYHDFLEDSKMLSLAFEDQRHYVGVLALKSRGSLDQDCELRVLDRLVAQMLWIDHSIILEVKARLVNAGLIDGAWQPLAWEKRQQPSDSSAERAARYRQKMKAERVAQLPSRDGERDGNAVDKIRVDKTRVDNIKHSVEFSTAPAKTKPGYSIDFEEFWRAYPSDRRGSKKRAFIEWRKLDADKGLIIGDILNRVKVDKLFIEDDGKFVPHAERWLSGERWLNDIKPVSRFGDVTDKNIRVGMDWVENGL